MKGNLKYFSELWFVMAKSWQNCCWENQKGE